MNGAVGNFCTHTSQTGPEIKLDDTAHQTQVSKFEPCRSEVEYATSPQFCNIYEWAGKKHVSLKPDY